MALARQTPEKQRQTWQLIAWWVVIVFVSCQSTDSPPATSGRAVTDAGEPLFTKVATAHSGLDFQNTITESPELNYLNFNNLYSGGGVAVGDFNNDGLPDLYFTGNMVSDRLYLNKGNLQFEDVTATALPAGYNGWHRGVSLVDVNHDGFLDIYVCRTGVPGDSDAPANLLFLNNGEADQPTFNEAAASFGLADAGNSVQAVWFDYDRDGDLDCYVLNQPSERTPDQKPYTVAQVQQLVASGQAPTDRLYRNNAAEGEPATFTEVTREAGVYNMSYSLGAGLLDANNDGWTDLYVANDYSEPDFLYMNRSGAQGFDNEVKAATGHVSNFGMGVDVADINNDGFQDIIVLDMAYKSMVRAKKNMGAMRPEQFYAYIDAGYQYQYMINTLQLNNGNGTFSEIAQLAGVAKTDWSWAPLFEDLDNDGWADLYITNGNYRDVRNNDMQVNLAKAFETTGGKADFNQIMELLPVQQVPNNCFRNNGDLTFAEVSREWGLHEPSTSHGLAIADLDRDGDLDMVMNRMDQPVTLYENHNHIGNNVVRIKLEGSELNARALGATVSVTTAEGTQTKNMQTVRGYQSCQEAILHFGIGEATNAQVLVEWPDGRISQADATANTLTTLMNSTGTEDDILGPEGTLAFVFSEPDDFTGSHKEAAYDDFATEILLPHRYSRLGPMLATGDVNGDGLDDVFFPGAKDHASVLVQQAAKGWNRSSGGPWTSASKAEDVGAELFDADADGDLDLLVLPGGNEYAIKSEELRPRLYMNDGNGNFTDGSSRLPEMVTSSMRAAVGDFDGDGDNDVFIGGRITPGYYPFAPRSYLLRNDETSFTDVTQELAPDLMGPGLVTDARFADMDGDGDQDLVVVGEWMPVSVYNNEGGRFTNLTPQSSLATSSGWWYSLAIADFDSDGDLDIAAGNLGYNAKYHASKDEPLHVYCADFDQSGTYDIVLAMHQDQQLYPVRGRECSSEQMPFISQKFPTYAGFAEAGLSGIYTQNALDNALHLAANTLASSLFFNEGNGRYTQVEMPMHAQKAPINCMVVTDLNNDGHNDLIVAGNNHDVEVETVRYDAGTGLVLLGTGSQHMNVMTSRNTGLYLAGNVRDMELVETPTGQQLIVTNNNGPAQAILLSKNANTP